MGAKGDVFAFGGRRPRLAMAAHRPQPEHDAAAARSMATRLFGDLATPAGDPLPLADATYPANELGYIGVFGDVVVLTGAAARIRPLPGLPSIDAPMTVDLQFHSISGHLALDYRDDTTGQDRGVMFTWDSTWEEAEELSAGVLLPFEAPLWGDPPADPAGAPGPSPWEFGQESMRWVCGVVVEGVPQPDDLPDSSTLVHPFRFRQDHTSDDGPPAAPPAGAGRLPVPPTLSGPVTTPGRALWRELPDAIRRRCSVSWHWCSRPLRPSSCGCPGRGRSWRWPESWPS